MWQQAAEKCPSRLGRQITRLPNANGGDEVGQMGGFQRPGATVVRDLLERLSLFVKDRSAGRIAREVTPFAVNDNTAVPVFEPPQRGSTLPRSGCGSRK